MAAKRKASVLLHKDIIPNVAKNEHLPEHSTEDSYASLLKDADKLKLMLLAWNYQNSNAVRNGVEVPDFGVIGDLWTQYQNALSSNGKRSSVSPLLRDQSSPTENQDETNSLGGQKDEDDGSEDDSDDKLDQNAQDPERLKAFNMFVRLFVDENLDRMIPISKQPKEKIQAIIDSCARQFPEFCERSRKRIRTYLKSCRRNKKTREGWDNISRPTPAHLTSVQAEQILAIACENESLNAKRIRVGLDPITQTIQVTGSTSNAGIDTMIPGGQYGGFRTILNSTVKSMDNDSASSSNAQIASPNIPISSSRNSPLSLNFSAANTSNSSSTVNVSEVKNPSVCSTIVNDNSNDITNITSLVNNGSSHSNNNSVYRSADCISSTQSSAFSSRIQNQPSFFTNIQAINNLVPTDLSMKSRPHIQGQQQQLQSNHTNLMCLNSSRAPIAIHKLNESEITAARQVIIAYRESAAFLLRTAEQVEQLLLQQQ